HSPAKRVGGASSLEGSNPSLSAPMSEWPQIAEPELLERLSMDDEEFREYIRALLAAMPPRTYDDELFTRAMEYPWHRPEGSYRLSDDGVELLAGLATGQREQVIQRLGSPRGGGAPAR